MREPILLTPGPLTTSLATKTAMLTDWGSWDSRFKALTASVCHDLLAIAGGLDSHVCVPLQGSGTFAVEAAVANLVPRDGKLLVLAGGAYGQRMADIARYLGRPYSVYATADDSAPDAATAGDAAARRSGHHTCGPGALRNQYRHAEPAARAGSRRACCRPPPDRGRDVQLRRTAHRRGRAAHRRAGGQQQQVPGRRARHGLRHRQPGQPGTERRQQPFAGAGPARAAAVPANHRPMALYPAHPRGSGAACCTGPISGRRRPTGAAGRVMRPTPALLADALQAGGLRPFLPPALAGADHPHLPRAGPPRLPLVPPFTKQYASRALCSTPASSPRRKPSASAASAPSTRPKSARPPKSLFPPCASSAGWLEESRPCIHLPTP